MARSSVQRWRRVGAPKRRHIDRLSAWRPSNPDSYSYLLGIYLGDGYIAKAKQAPVLEISLDLRYPGIIAECIQAIWRILEVRARTSIRKTPKGESIRITASSSHWPQVFPQHGPGKKHERPIVLDDWQKDAIKQFPKAFIRGLIHSDGSRVINRFTVGLPSGVSREYAYARYFFTNLSTDIQGLFCASCDQLNIRWTKSSSKNISVANRQSVALLDSFVGIKC